MIKQFIIASAALVCANALLPVVLGPGDNSKTAKFLKESEASKQYRLPRNTAPRVYIIEFDPDFGGEKFTFKGNGSIIFKVLQPTSSVTFHRSNKIAIDKAYTKLIDKNGVVLEPIDQEWNSQNEFYSIKFRNKLKPGNYDLKLKWTGDDAGNDWFDQQSGFFREKDLLDGGQTQYLVTTQFQPVGARDAFPCWDEPGFRAQFEISIKHDPNYTALSNMPVRTHQELPNSKIVTHFERSVAMSTYLVCLTVANYKPLRGDRGINTFYGLESNLPFLKQSLEISEKVLEAMEAYTGVPYALPKLDHVTIPKYQATGMEHWGLASYNTPVVTLKNTTLIPDDENYYNGIVLVAHETIHQWFGNLVTPLWWDDLWLSESMTTYFQFKLLDQILPDIHGMDYTVIIFMNGAFDTEDSENAKPIKWIPRNKIEYDKIFSSTTYQKGAAVLHMLEHVLTKEVFQKGIVGYLKANQFHGVVSDDLAEGFQNAYDEAFKEKLDLNVKEFVDLWVEQTGTPLLTVTRNYETGETVVAQKNSREINPDNKWKIPINYATKSNPDFSSTVPMVWMNEDQDTITLPDIDTDDWIILNIQQRGFYQVNYDKENWYRLAKCLVVNHEKFHPLNRAQLLTDAWRLFDSDKSNIEIIFNITAYLGREKNILVWKPAAEIISEMGDMVRKTEIEDLFKSYVLSLTKDMTYQDFSSYYTRNQLVPVLCDFGHPDCRSTARKLFTEFMKNPSKDAFPSSDWDWVICSALRELGLTEWEKYMNDSSLEKIVPSSKYLFIKCTDDKDKRDKYLDEMLKSNANVSKDLATDVLQALIESNSQNFAYILQYFNDHLEAIRKFYENDTDNNLVTLLARMIAAVKTQQQFDKMKSFMETHEDKFKEIISDPEMTVKSVLEEVKISVSLAEQFKKEFNKYINRNFVADIENDKSSIDACK
ncbi:aminopeptidase N-like [Cotesia glomerata]|uniref:aminopeptidase N-like n=1 Tax=Cotesia glomerata TaxID=32391 RepID=UPI001D03271D|nr:aminopeptidase N-like [Cotesia glomerata]